MDCRSLALDERASSRRSTHAGGAHRRAGFVAAGSRRSPSFAPRGPSIRRTPRSRTVSRGCSRPRHRPTWPIRTIRRACAPASTFSRRLRWPRPIRRARSRTSRSWRRSGRTRCGTATRALEVYRDILAVEPGRRGAVLGLGRNAGRAGDARELFRALVLEADQAKDAGSRAHDSCFARPTSPASG